MKNKTLSLFLSLAMIISMLPQMGLNVRADVSDTFNIDGVSYKVTEEDPYNKKVTVIDTDEKNVIIPAEIKNPTSYITYEVVSIENVGNTLEKLIFERGSELNQILKSDLFNNTTRVKKGEKIEVFTHESNESLLSPYFEGVKNVVVVNHGDDVLGEGTMPTCTEMGKTRCDICETVVERRLDRHSVRYKVNYSSSSFGKSYELSCEKCGKSAKVYIDLENDHFMREELLTKFSPKLVGLEDAQKLLGRKITVSDYYFTFAGNEGVKYNTLRDLMDYLETKNAGGDCEVRLVVNGIEIYASFFVVAND